MKKAILLMFLVTIGVVSFAQNSGKGFNYQAIARDASGNIRKSELINLRFSLLIGSSTGTADWVETHNVNTDAFGAFAVIIGKGTKEPSSVLSSFNLLDFKIRSYWLKIEIKQDTSNSTWLEISNQQLLSVPYAENVINFPIGTTISYCGLFTTKLQDEGWLPCDGRIVNKTDYPDLFTIIGEMWGNGNDGAYNQTTGSGSYFNIPDFRGVFMRGWDNGANNDPDVTSRVPLKVGGNSGNNVGSLQNDAFSSHRHDATICYANNPPNMSYTSGNGALGHDDATYNIGRTTTSNYLITLNTMIQLSGASSETRPKNVYVNYLIKVK